MEYLKTLGMSDLITYLELEPQSANFKKVERVLLLKEKDLEKCKERCSELSKTLKENEVKSSKMEGMLVEFSGYKALSEELREKVTRLEDNCKIISEKESKATESFTALLLNHQNLERTRKEENLQFNLKIADLECAKSKVEGEIEVLRGECEQLETMRKHSKELEQKLQMSEDECSKLLQSLEEEKKKTVEMEDTVQELTKYRASCDELKEEVSRLEENSKTISEREKTAVQNVINLTADLENLRRFRNEELSEFKTKYTDLELAKQEAEVEIEALKRRCEELEKSVKDAKDLEKDLEKSKARCCELSAAVEEKSKKNLEVEEKLKEAQKYRATCEGLRKKVNCLEQSYMVSNENEKSANQKIIELSGELEKLKKKRSEELNDLKTKNKDLEFAKQKVNIEINIQKKRCQELEKVVGDLDKELKISMEKYSELLASHGEEKKKNLAMEGSLEELKEYKRICERLEETVTSLEESCRIAKEREKCGNEKVNKLTDDLQKLNGDRIKEASELKRKIKDLECAKQKAEDQIEDQKKRYEEMEKKMKHSINDLEKKLRKSKARCTELSTSLEGDSKKVAEEGKLEERKKYEMIYTELKEKITLLHNDCKIIKQRGKSVEKGINNLLGDLVNFEPNEASAVKCDSPVLPKANVEVKTEVSKNERKKDENKQRKVQSKTNGGVTGACSSNLKIKLKPPSCDGRASDSVHAVTLGQSTPEVNSGEKVKVYSQKRKRKQTPEPVCLNGEASQMQVDKVNMKHNKRIASGTEHRSDYSGDKCLFSCGGEHTEESRHCSVAPCEEKENKGRNEGIPAESLVMSGTLIEKSENLTIDDAKEKSEMDKRQREKAEVDKRHLEKADVDKRQLEKAEVDKRQLEKAEVDKRQLEKAEVDKRQLRRIIHPPVRLNL